MRIAAQYSHLNGFEFLLVHHRERWKEIETVIGQVDAERCRTKASKEKRKAGAMLYSLISLNEEMKGGFKDREWREQVTAYWVTDDAQLIQKTMQLAPDEQKMQISAGGGTPIYSFNQTDFVKNRIAVEVQFGKYAFVAYDLFVKHMAFFVGNVIDVGVEILPMKALQAEMSSGVGYYERELYNVLRQGRGVPAVPLVLLGVVP